MLERDAVKIIKEALEKAGFLWVRKNHGGIYSAGRTDLEALNPHGRLIALEVKKDRHALRSNVTRLQMAELKAICMAGGLGMAVHIQREYPGKGRMYVTWFRPMPTSCTGEPELFRIVDESPTCGFYTGITKWGVCDLYDWARRLSEFGAPVLPVHECVRRGKNAQT
jgi:hypothetical protein